MRRAIAITLDDEMKRTLVALSRSRSVSVRFVERVKVVLLAAEGKENIEIAQHLKITRQKVARWRNRFVANGLNGIEKDAPRSGRFPSISRARKSRVIKKTLEETPANATHWSRASMAKATGLSESTIGRIWREHGLKPHRHKTFKF